MFCKSRKPDIEYPCKWLFKVIGAVEVEIREAIETVILEESCHVELSNRSRTGKYLSFNVEVIVANEERRDLIYHDLQAHPAVKFVM